MKTSEENYAASLAIMTTIIVASLSKTLRSGGHPEIIQENLIPIYQVGNLWGKHSTLFQLLTLIVNQPLHFPTQCLEFGWMLAHVNKCNSSKYIF